ncbi:unnamed protein product, partial [Ilex paraguariensis]
MAVNYLASPRRKQSGLKAVLTSLELIIIQQYMSKTAYILAATRLGIVRSRLVETTGERDGVPTGEPTGMPAFFVVPRGMEEIVNYLKNRYRNKPMFVTENGYSPPEKEEAQVQDVLHDVKRIEFHKGYFASLAQAI